jgi:hypothetical protein
MRTFWVAPDETAPASGGLELSTALVNRKAVHLAVPVGPLLTLE